MQKRRTALARLALAISATCCGFISCARFRTKTVSSADLSRLNEDLKRLARPSNSTEGVPVLLICENLAAPTSPAQPPNPESRELASSFRTIAEVYSEAKPGTPASDLSKVIELLALRDFGAPKTP